MSEPGLRSLPARRPEPRSGNHRVRNQGRFCNIVGGVISPVLSNLYLNEVDRMLEKAKTVTQTGQWTHIEYARYADDRAPGNVCSR